MAKRTAPLWIMAAGIMILFMFPFSGKAFLEKGSNPTIPPDRIIINLPPETGTEDMPPVPFLHTRHTEAVEGKCLQCHIQTEGTVVFRFQRTDLPASKALYHDNCIVCHEQQKSAGKPAGPTTAECRQCHGASVPDPEPGTHWEKIDFNRSLHYIHEVSDNIAAPNPESSPDNCQACHHQYDESLQQIVMERGTESACIYCHKEDKTDGVRSIREASHDACVACHLKKKDQAVKAGPVDCAGCHAASVQSELPTVENPPRMKRNQPDAVFMAGGTTETDETVYRMAPVIFDHKNHETAAVSCRTCHHDSLESCTECHTPKGHEKGGFVRLEQAMHADTDPGSCVGCHVRETREPDCAGCHDSMSRSRMTETSCRTCHNDPDPTVVHDPELQKLRAQQFFASASDEYRKVTLSDVPETVTIGTLSDTYQPSRFPHRKIIRGIAERVEDSDLANTFHKSQQTLCMGCHHNSPASLTPPGCASCHAVAGDGIPAPDPAIADLKTAYHGQCMGCHQKMGIESVPSTDCLVCHEKK
jgi:hypothetical protein